MYARQVSFKVNADRRPEVEALADQVFSFMKSLQGFVSVHFLISEDENDYGAISLWESKKNAETAGESIRSKIGEALEKLATEPSVERLFEVYRPPAEKLFELYESQS